MADDVPPESGSGWYFCPSCGTEQWHLELTGECLRCGHLEPDREPADDH